MYKPEWLPYISTYENFFLSPPMAAVHLATTASTKLLVNNITGFGMGDDQFSSVIQLYRTLGDPMDCSVPGLPVQHQLPELAQTQVHWVSDAIQPSNPLSSPSPPAFILSQHQGLFKWVSSSHQVSKVLEFQLQHLSFQWIFRSDFL